MEDKDFKKYFKNENYFIKKNKDLFSLENFYKNDGDLKFIIGDIEKILKQKSAPDIERLSGEEKAGYSVSECSTLDIVEDMIVNAYSYLRREDYNNAERQLSILKSVDLNGVFENDEKIIKRIRRAISKLEERLSEKLSSSLNSKG